MTTQTTPPHHTALTPRPDMRVQPASARRAADWARRAPLMPALIFTIVVTQLPFVVTLVISFMNWNSLRPTERGFAGFDNYVQVFSNAALRAAVVNTLVLTVTVVLVSLVLGLAIALLLDRKFLGRGAVRTMMIAPFLVVPIAAALLWKHALFNPSYGLFNGLLTTVWGWFGSDSPPQPDWISTVPKFAVEASLILDWSPFMMLILLSVVQSRPLDVFESAGMCGVSTWKNYQ